MLCERLAVLCKLRGRLAMMTTIVALQGFSEHTAINAYLQQIIGDGGGLTTGAVGPFTVGIDGLRVAATVITGLTVERFGCKKLFVSSGLMQVSYFTPSVLVTEEGGGARSIDVSLNILMYWHGHLYSKLQIQSLPQLKVYSLYE